MTAQIQDYIEYQDEDYAIIGVKGEGLPSPEDFVMTRTMMHTVSTSHY